MREVASENTAKRDLRSKHDDYATFGITEYCRFDETGEYHGEGLAGERLVDGEYVPIGIERLTEDTLRGHSDVLNLDVRLHGSLLEWYDPETGCHVVSLEDERARADNERAGRIRGESRTRELEEELLLLRGEQGHPESKADVLCADAVAALSARRRPAVLHGDPLGCSEFQTLRISP